MEPTPCTEFRSRLCSFELGFDADLSVSTLFASWIDRVISSNVVGDSWPAGGDGISEVGEAIPLGLEGSCAGIVILCCNLSVGLGSVVRRGPQDDSLGDSIIGQLSTDSANSAISLRTKAVTSHMTVFIVVDLESCGEGTQVTPSGSVIGLETPL
jgi:hypothetical protein